MNITYFVTTGDGIGGTERAAITQANMFAAHGHEVTVLSVYRDTGRPIFHVDDRVRLRYMVDLPEAQSGTLVADQVSLMGGRSWIIPARWDNQFCADSDAAVIIALRSISTDILVTTTPALTALAAEFAPPSVVVVQQEHRATSGRNAASFEPIRRYAPKTDCLVSLTQRSTEWLALTLDVDPPRLETIPNSIPDDFYPRPDLDARVVMSAGRLVAGKNFADLILAFSVASQEIPGWRLRIYGQGNRERQLRSQIRTLQLEDQVELVPPVPDLLAEWSKASVFAMTSRSEGLPLVALEAMATGLPLVAYDCETGPADIIDDDVNGLLVPDGDVTAMAEALTAVMGDRELRSRYGEGSLATVPRFSPEAIYRRWEDLFLELLQAKEMHPERPHRAQLPKEYSMTQSEPVITGKNADDVGHHIAIQPLGDLRPAAQSQQNLRRVEDALSTAEIPHFWVPGYSPDIEVMAVPHECRDQVLAALAQCDDAGVVVQAMAGNSRLSVDPWLVPSEPPTSPMFERANALRVYCRASDRSGAVETGHDHGCDIEFWRENADGLLTAPRHNRGVDLVHPDDLRKLTFRRVRDIDVPTIQLLSNSTSWDEPHFPIDAVYTWVDDTDPEWRATKFEAQGPLAAALHSESVSDARFRNRDELKYSLRSVEAFAPWIRHVYLVTAGQRPSWLRKDHPGLTLVDHREIFPDHKALPTFNSHAIEAVLHRIEGLSEHYMYINDDVMFARSQQPSQYFHANGNTKFFPSPVKINDLGEDAPPHLAAAANNRGLLQRDFDLTISQGMLHTPSPQARSIGLEIENRYGEEWKRTVFSRFRSGRDLSIPSSMSHYLAYALGRATTGAINYRYLGLGARDLGVRMNQILRSASVDVVALGDPPGGVADPDAVDFALHNFLEQLLPWPSRFEVDPPVSRELSEDYAHDQE